MKYLLATLLTFLAIAVPTPALAACGTGSTSKGQAYQELNQVNQATGTTTDCNGTQVKGLVYNIVILLSWIAGIMAIIFVLISGMKYVTSGGDANAVKSAKATLVYAIIGLAILALAQFIAHFALAQASSVAL